MRLCEITTYVPKLQWAVGPNQAHARGYGRTLQNDPTYTVMWVNIRDAFRLGYQNSALDPDDPTGGENSIGDRVERAKRHWANGGWMNPSVCSINVHGQFDWGDGRHRMVAAAQLGEVYSPVLIDTADLEKFRQSGIATIKVG